MRSDTATLEPFVAAIEELNLVGPVALEQARAFLRAGGGSAEALADHLVEGGFLTRFQADVILAGNANKLVLSLFTLTDEIGSGSMGTVYRARSAKDDSTYAIKIVPRRNVINLQSIGEKVQALKQVRHPRVSAMVQVGAQGERVYMVWPFLEGGEKLDALVRRQGKLQPRQAAQVALQVASGLQAYHEKDLFHGLLKPSDVLIGSDRRVRILDFGVGFLLTCERGKSLLDTTTNSRALARGLDCSSPESILDPLARSVWGDQYSLGCILYFCLTGHFPFPDNNPVKKMMGHQFEEPTSVRDLVPEVSSKLAAIVHRLLRKTPQERYFSIQDVVTDLQLVTSDSRPSPCVGTRPSAQGQTPAPTRLSAQGQVPPTRPSAQGQTPAPTRPSAQEQLPLRSSAQGQVPTRPSAQGQAPVTPPAPSPAPKKPVTPTRWATLAAGQAPADGEGVDRGQALGSSRLQESGGRLSTLVVAVVGVAAGVAAGALAWFLTNR
jgi:serine/threonine-protein kinase